MKQRCFNFAFILSTFLAVTAFAENTAVIPAPRTFPTNWMSSHEAFVKQAKQGGIDLLFLGDSITAGWLWGNGGLNIWNKRYAPRHAAEFGIGYDRTQNVLWRIEHGELEGIKPKVVVLLIGTNNAGNEDNGKPRNTTPEIVEGVAAIVNELRARDVYKRQGGTPAGWSFGRTRQNLSKSHPLRLLPRPKHLPGR